MNKKQKDKLAKPDWFDIKNYRNPSYLDPGYWAYQLEVRKILLIEISDKEHRKKELLEKEIEDFNIEDSNKEHVVKDIDPKMLEIYETIKKKGLLGLDWSFPDLSLASIGIMDTKSNIKKSDNSALLHAETVRQEQAKNNFYTNTVSVTTAFELFNTANFMKDNLKESIIRMNSLTSGIGKEITNKDERDIESACELYPTGENFNGLSYIQVDLTAPDELILKDFKKVLSTLQSNEGRLSKTLKRSKTMKLDDWTNNNMTLLDSGILPYLDLLIYSKIKNKSLIDSEANEYIFGDQKNYVFDKIKRTTKKLANEMIHENQIEALRIEYMSLPSSDWEKKAKSSS